MQPNPRRQRAQKAQTKHKANAQFAQQSHLQPPNYKKRQYEQYHIRNNRHARRRILHFVEINRGGGFGARSPVCADGQDGEGVDEGDGGGEGDEDADDEVADVLEPFWDEDAFVEEG